MTDLWYGTSGPKDAEIVIVGEAWGESESFAKTPFVGASGHELTRMLAEAGIDRTKCLLTNVVAARPDSNEMWRFFNVYEGTKSSQLSIRHLNPTPFVVDECNRLYTQINAFPRKLVIAVGNYSLWALTDSASPSASREGPKDNKRTVPAGIMDWRGSMWYILKSFTSTEYSETKLLPIIHPASILRQWSLRAVTVHDLKSRVPMALRNDWRHKVKPLFLAPPTFDQAKSRLEFWLRRADSGTTLELTEDIETIRASNLITVIGLTDSTSFAMAMPFVRKLPDGSLTSYWTPKQEVELFRLICRLNSHKNIKITGQNFLYDTQYFQHWFGVTPRVDFDTMLAQHLLWPGTPKGLDYISSLYCKYHWYWKEDGKEWDTKGTLEDLLVYNCWDLVRTHEAAGVLRDLIVQCNQQAQWEFSMHKFYFCLGMMNRGARVDRELRGQQAGRLSQAVAAISSQLERIIPQDSIVSTSKTKSKSRWYRSPKQTNLFVFQDMLGIRLPVNRKTGNITGGKEALQDLPRRYPEFKGIFSRLQTLRSVEVFKSHFIDAQLDHRGRLCSSFNPAGTETHRLSSSINAFGVGTNLQNIPEGDEK